MRRSGHAVVLAALAGAAAGLSGCDGLAKGGSEQAAAKAPRQVTEIDPATLAARVAKGAVLLVDVRTPEEFAEGHIAGAVNMPVEEFDPKALPVTPGKETVLYCRSGKRSARAGDQLLAAGAAQAQHLSGGIVAWREAGLPTTR